jgi:hypothetical protein
MALLTKLALLSRYPLGSQVLDEDSSSQPFTAFFLFMNCTYGLIALIYLID